MAGRLHCLVIILTAFCRHCSTEVTWNVEPTRSTPEHHIANAINNFGYKIMLQMMKERKNDNVIISPTGIAGILAMTLLGTIGKTYDEIAENLGFSQDMLNRQDHEHFGYLLNQLNANVSSKTMYADAMFVDDHIKTRVREVYRNYLNYVYQGQVLSANFAQSEETKVVINEWVKNHTEGKIKNFLKQPLPASTRVVLLCALYFRAQWKTPFIPEYTAKMAFRKPTEEVLADLMLGLGEFDYLFSEIDGLHMIALPYNDSTTTMYALKPRFPQRLSLQELIKRLDYKKLDNLINLMTKKKCVVRFPRMDLTTTTNLANTLKALGIQSMFIQGKANFALMVEGDLVANKTENDIITKINTEGSQAKEVNDKINTLINPGIHVDSILHDVKISINEYGTEAVAATGAILARSAEQFYADSPFYMFIRNEKTKLVTFSAIINDPTI